MIIILLKILENKLMKLRKKNISLWKIVKLKVNMKNLKKKKILMMNGEYCDLYVYILVFYFIFIIYIYINFKIGFEYIQIN